MATIGFTVAATAATASIEGTLAAAAIVAAATAAGSIVDREIVYPALGLTPRPEDIQGPRIDDLELTFASEGSPKNYCMGPTNKVPGTVIWIGKLATRKITTQIGSGKNKASQIRFEQFVNLAIGFNTGKTISDITDIWANGELIMTRTASIQITDSSQVLTATKAFWFTSFTNAQGKKVMVAKVVVIIRAPAASTIDLSQFQTTKPVTVEGWANAGNNGTFKVLSVGKSSSSSWITLDNPNAVTEPAGVVSPSLSQQATTWDQRLFKSINIYKGDQVIADPLIEAEEGAANAKIWDKEAYIVIRDFNLTEFNGVIPYSWSIGVEAEISTTVGAAIGEIIERGGLPASRHDVSALTESLRGYYYNGPRSSLEAINPLVVAFDILAQERNGKIVFYKRGSAPEVDVSASDMTAHEPGTAPPPKPALVARANPKDLPAEVLVEYIDADAKDLNGDPSYDKGEARAPRNVASLNPEVIRQVLARVVLTKAEALKVAKRILWTMLANQRRIACQLPPSYAHVQQGDILKVPVGDGTKRMLVERLQRGHNYMLIAEGPVEEAQTLSW